MICVKQKKTKILLIINSNLNWRACEYSIHNNKRSKTELKSISDFIFRFQIYKYILMVVFSDGNWHNLNHKLHIANGFRLDRDSTCCRKCIMCMRNSKCTLLSISIDVFNPFSDVNWVQKDTKKWKIKNVWQFWNFFFYKKKTNFLAVLNSCSKDCAILVTPI